MKKVLDSINGSDLFEADNSFVSALIETFIYGVNEQKNPASQTLAQLLQHIKSNMSDERILKRVTPFLRFYIRKFIFDEVFYGDDFLNIILLHVVDSFSDVLKEQVFSLNFEKPTTIYLPNLKLICFNAGCSKLQINTHGNQVSITDLDQGVKSFFSFHEKSQEIFSDIRIFSDKTLVKDKHLGAVLPMEKISFETDYQKLVEAFNLINALDSDLFQEISSLIDYIVPLKVIVEPESGKKISQSETNSSMTGLICTSIDLNPAWLSENIIHEYSHNLLNVFLQFHTIFRNDTLAVYYSPWRPDPRPLIGLFHAIFVFVAVLDFYCRYFVAQSERKSINKTEMEELKFQIQTIFYMIEFAFSQVNEPKLTKIGSTLYAQIKLKFNKLAQQFYEENEPAFQVILRHARTWRNQNKVLQEHLIIPQKWSRRFKECSVSVL